MGIARGAAKLLFVESLRRPFEGRALMLGKQDVFFSYETLQKISDEFGVQLRDNDKISLSLKPELAAEGYISDESLFKSLGFSECATLDYSDYESAEYIFDLNKSEVPEPLLEAFDLIVDAGTIEHVFHLPNVFNNIFKMLKQGGRIIHLSPSSNYMDHGFYMFSPTLFWDFYETNRFEINTFQIVRHTIHAHTEPWEISDYRPGLLDPISFGGLDDGMYGILCIATKMKDSTGDAIPQQRFFVKHWETPKDENLLPDADVMAAHPSSTYQALKEFVKKSPLFYKTLRVPIFFMRSLKQKHQSRKKGLRLKIVARY